MTGLPAILLRSMLAALAFDSPRLVPLVIALVAAVAVGVAALYLPQAKSLSRRGRWAMAGLRIAGLTAVAASILQPVIHRPPRAEELGAVVIVVDRSRGMGVADRQRTPAQLVALADGLGRLPPGVRYHTDDFTAALRLAGEQLDRLSAVVAEISFARMRGLGAGDATPRLEEAIRGFDAAASSLTSRRSTLRPKAPAVEILAGIEKSLDALRALPLQTAPERGWIDSTRASLDRLAPAVEALQTNEDARLYASNKQVRAICEELHGLNRLGLVEQAMVSPGIGLLSTLPPQVPVFGFSAGAGVDPLPLKSDGRPIRRLIVESGGPAVDSGSAVRAALDQLRGMPVQAVILFSGGHETAGVPPVVSGVPVFAVASAPQVPGRDLSVSLIDVPQEAAVGEPVTVKARVHGIGLRGTMVEVRFTAGPPHTPPPIAPGPQVATLASSFAGISDALVDVVSRRAVLGDDGTAILSFVVTFETAGAQPVRLRVADLAGEITTENNSAERWVKVIGEKTKVAMLAGSPGWEFRGLRDLLEGDPRYSVTSEVLDEGPSVSLSPKQILSQQLLVLYDLPCAAMNAEQWAAVKRLAAERCGAVVIIAGPDHLPNERGTVVLLTTDSDRSIADYLTPGPAAELLPFVLDKGADGRQEVVANWHTWQGQDAAYQLVPSPAVASAAWLKLLDTPADNARRWESLAPVYSYLAMPPLKPGVRALLVERASGTAVVTEHPLGGGRVVFVGTSETWRWRLKAGGRDYARFWQQLLRHVAEPPYAATASEQSDRYSLDLPAAAQPREAVPVRVRFCSEDGGPLAAAVAKVRVVQRSTEIASLSLAPSGAAPGRFAGAIPPLARGDYTVQLISPEKGTVVVSYPLRIAAHDELEVQDVTGDRAALARLAESSGGELIPFEQVNTIAARLAAHRLKQIIPTTLPLWDSGYLFLFVLGCLAAEWSLRKRAGLA